MSTYLETARVRLRAFVPADEDNLFDLDSDPEVMRYLTHGVPSTREYVQGSIQRVLALAAKHEGRFGFWAAIERSSDRFMGWFHFRPSRAEPEKLERIELGYRLKREFWRLGYATEVSRALVTKGFEELGVEEVFAVTMRDNIASRRVMEKCGLTFVREFVDVDPSGLEMLEVELALTRAEWQRRRSP